MKPTTIFPTTLLKNTIDRDWSVDEITFINEQRNSINPNHGNMTSLNRNILDAPEMSGLKEEALKICNEYLKTIACAEDDIEVYITQSWLNWTQYGEYHHIHNHPNSIYSGVIYIEAYDKDEITFHDLTHYPIQIKPKYSNIYNARNVHFPVQTKDIILFNSSLPHSVENRQEYKGTRVSIAFNTFLRGNLGNNETLTQLNLQ